MRWRDPKKELPTNFTGVVAVMTQHWKKNNPISSEIYFGEVEWNNSGKQCRVCTGDYSGKGSWSLYFEEGHDDEIVAWMPSNEFIMPGFLDYEND